MEELYKQMYLKYAPNLSEDELNNKVSYALTQDNDQFVNAFYSKYTGSGPSENTQNYISTMADPNEGKGFDVTGTEALDAFEIGIARMGRGAVGLAEQTVGGIRDIWQQAENWWDGEGWEKLTVQEKLANRADMEKNGINLGFTHLKTSDELKARIQKLQG